MGYGTLGHGTWDILGLGIAVVGTYVKSSYLQLSCCRTAHLLTAHEDGIQLQSRSATHSPRCPDKLERESPRYFCAVCEVLVCEDAGLWKEE